jgi:hypothetical protein
MNLVGNPVPGARVGQPALDVHHHSSGPMDPRHLDLLRRPPSAQANEPDRLPSGNVLLRAATAVVCCFVALRLVRVATRAGRGVLRLGPLPAALFFAIHPLWVESVAWEAERGDVLSGLRFLQTILTDLKADSGPGHAADLSGGAGDPARGRCPLRRLR